MFSVCPHLEKIALWFHVAPNGAWKFSDRIYKHAAPNGAGQHAAANGAGRQNEVLLSVAAGSRVGP